MIFHCPFYFLICSSGTDAVRQWEGDASTRPLLAVSLGCREASEISEDLRAQSGSRKQIFASFPVSLDCVSPAGATCVRQNIDFIRLSLCFGNIERKGAGWDQHSVCQVLTVLRASFY